MELESPARSCPNCRTPNHSDRTICWSCGFRLDGRQQMRRQCPTWVWETIAVMVLACITVGAYLLLTRTPAPREETVSTASTPPTQPMKPRQEYPVTPPPLPELSQPELQLGRRTTPTHPTARGGRHDGPAVLPSEPAPLPRQRPLGSAHVGDARLGVENDGQGRETCVGRVLIVNDGPYNVTDFRLGLWTAGGTYVLAPFEGNLSSPSPIYSRRLRPGETLDCPVMTTGYYPSYSVHGMKKVTLTATLDGPPGIITDECSLW